MKRKIPIASALRLLLFGQDKKALGVRRLILEQAGYAVVCATDPRRALEFAGNDMAAAVLVRDESLETILELASAIKGRSGDLPIVVLGRSPWASGGKAIVDSFIPKIDVRQSGSNPSLPC